MFFQSGLSFIALIAFAAVQLEEFGMNVERAVDGKNAVEIFRNHPKGTFDVILMDIMMPEMNGYEAAKAIRAMNDRPDGKNIPIIAMTANSFAEDVQASLDAGMNAHLSKPIVFDLIMLMITGGVLEAKEKGVPGELKIRFGNTSL